MVTQVHRVNLFLGAVAERVDEVALVGPDALGRSPNNFHISVGEEPLTADTVVPADSIYVIEARLAQG